MISLKLLKNLIYALLIGGIIFSTYCLVNWEIYPALQILFCLLLGISSMLISEMIKNLDKKLKTFILLTVLFQILISFLVIINKELVIQYWRIVFIPSLFIVFICTYGISIRKEEKYHAIFKWFTIILMTISFFRFFIYHQLIDYSIELIFLVFIILIIQAKNKPLVS